MTSLTEFLLARYAEDEAVAKYVSDSFAAAVKGAPPHWTPARVLADVEAKRRIVEMFSGDLHEKWDDGYEAGKMVAPILGTLALPYADHPDYKQEWRS